jgi:hypothetical protein
MKLTQEQFNLKIKEAMRKDLGREATIEEQLVWGNRLLEIALNMELNLNLKNEIKQHLEAAE